MFALQFSLYYRRNQPFNVGNISIFFYHVSIFIPFRSILLTVKIPKICKTSRFLYRNISSKFAIAKIIPNQIPKEVGVETVIFLHRFGRKWITVYLWTDKR